MHHHCLSICTNIAAAAILFTFVGSGRGGDVEEVDLGSGRGGNLHPSGMPSFLPAPCSTACTRWVSRPNTSSHHLSTIHYMLSYYLPELVISSSPFLDPGEAGINHPEFHRSSQFRSQTLLSRHRKDTRVISKINQSRVPSKLKCKARFYDHLKPSPTRAKIKAAPNPSIGNLENVRRGTMGLDQHLLVVV